MSDDLFGGLYDEQPVGDPTQRAARAALSEFFDEHRDEVFFSRQLEVLHEGEWYHWITNRALRELVADGVIKSERRQLPGAGEVNLMWHRSHRYFRRDATRLMRLIEEYANPNIGAAIGLQGEAMVLEGFARHQFVLLGREVREYRGQSWQRTAHDLDFIFERDGVGYGVEVKNTLGYMQRSELDIKLAMCAEIGVKPVLAARMLPKSWILDIIGAGGFALIMKYQLYPWAHRDLARRVQAELGLPVDSPRALMDGTMARFVAWHTRNL